MIFKSLHPLSPETNISHPPKVSKMQMEMMPQCDYTFPNSSQETQLKTTHATQKYPGRSPRNTYWCYHHIADSTTKKSPFCFISKLLLSPNAMFPSHCPVDPSSGSHVGGRCRSAAVTLPVGFYQKSLGTLSPGLSPGKDHHLEHGPTATKPSGSVPDAEMLGWFSLLCCVKPLLKVMNHWAMDFTVQPLSGFSCCWWEP